MKIRTKRLSTASTATPPLRFQFKHSALLRRSHSGAWLQAVDLWQPARLASPNSRLLREIADSFAAVGSGADFDPLRRPGQPFGKFRRGVTVGEEKLGL
jgi:hypothetical protein